MNVHRNPWLSALNHGGLVVHPTIYRLMGFNSWYWFIADQGAGR